MKDVKKVKQEIQQVNEAIFNILNYYTCPPDCHSFCCNVCPVDLTDKEYNKLRRLSCEKTDKSKVVKYRRAYVHQLDKPCPFLGSDELCTAYIIRPVTCHIYPFNMTETLPPLMQIFPCMMGKEIYKDYFEYKIYKIKKNNDIGINQAKAEISEALRGLDERSNSYYLSTDEDDNVKTIVLTFSEIFDFLDYLRFCQNRQ